MIGALVLTGMMAVSAAPDPLTRNVWAVAAKHAFLEWQSIPALAGMSYDLATTHTTLATCATSTRYSCEEGNGAIPGGQSDVGRTVWSVGIYYLIHVLLAWQENHLSEAAGEPVRMGSAFRWSLSAAYGGMRAAFGERNRRIGEEISMSVTMEIGR